MSWTLTISDPNGGSPTSVTQATSPPVTKEQPSCEVEPRGNCTTMTFRGRPDQLALPVRGIIQYEEDGNNLFWGPAVITPSGESFGAGPADQDSDSLERYTIAGGAQLVHDSMVEGYLLLVDDYYGLASVDVASIAYELCSRYAHPALTVSAANFPATGSVLSTYYKPECQLDEALDELAKTVSTGAHWWVDATGAIHFEAG